MNQNLDTAQVEWLEVVERLFEAKISKAFFNLHPDIK